jgi:O-antigen ligase
VGLGVAIGVPLTIQSPHILLTALLILSPLRTLIATESAIQLPLDIGQILLAVYLGNWGVFAIYRRVSLKQSEISPILKVLLVLVIVFGFNVWHVTSVSAWLTEWLKWCVIAVLVWHIEISEKHTWRWLVFAFLISAVANAIVGLYIFFGGSGADHLVILGRFFRAFGTFGQPNPFGGFMGIALPIALMSTVAYLVQAWTYRHTRKHHLFRTTLIYLVLAGLTSGILLAGLIASWSRGAWLGFGVSVMVMTFAIPRKLLTSITSATLLFALVITLWIGGLIPQSIVNRITTAATDFITIDDIRGVDITTINYAVVERVAHWQAAINMTEAHPLFGVGLGNYEIVYNDYRLLNWKEPLGHAHNYYLNILAEAGIMGLLAYLSFWVVIVSVTWRIRQHPNTLARYIGIGLLGSWTYIAVHSIFDNLYVNNLFLHIGLLLGILAVLNQQVWKTITLE